MFGFKNIDIKQKEQILTNHLNKVLIIVFGTISIIELLVYFLRENSEFNVTTFRVFLVFVISVINYFVIASKRILLSKLILTIGVFFFLTIFPMLFDIDHIEYILWFPFLANALVVIPLLIFDFEKEKGYIRVISFIYLMFASFVDIIALMINNFQVPIWYEIQYTFVFIKVVHIASFLFIYWAISYLKELVITHLRTEDSMKAQLISNNLLIKKQADNVNQQNEMLQQKRDLLSVANDALSTLNKELLQKRNELEEALNNLKTTQAIVMQKNKMASLGVMVSGIAHEINNPLNYIQSGLVGLEDFIEDNFPNMSNDVKARKNEITSTIELGIGKIHRIVVSLGYFVENENSQQKKCCLNEIIQNCLLVLNNQIKNKIALQIDIDDNIPLFYCNENRMHLMFMNLLSNAIFATPLEGTIFIKMNVEKSTDSEISYIILKITDTGIGIAETEISKIFDPFYTTKEVGEGVGLGLTMVYGIVKEHNGEIFVDSKIGEGTSFIIKLPVS